MVATRAQAARTAAPGFFGRHGSVFLYVPNLIGYARVAFSLVAFALAGSSPYGLTGCYLMSFVCDELDGRFARKFDQTSTFGMVLDMVTDRVSTTCLLAVLCMHYPRATLAFLALIQLDIFSHWFHMYAALATGEATHKNLTSRSRVVQFYYRNRIFMGFCCICCEVLYLALYLLAWPERLGAAGVLAVRLVALAALPGFAIKQAVNVVQLRGASRTLVEYDGTKQQ